MQDTRLADQQTNRPSYGIDKNTNLTSSNRLLAALMSRFFTASTKCPAGIFRVSLDCFCSVGSNLESEFENDFWSFWSFWFVSPLEGTIDGFVLFSANPHKQFFIATMRWEAMSKLVSGEEGFQEEIEMNIGTTSVEQGYDEDVRGREKKNWNKKSLSKRLSVFLNWGTASTANSQWLYQSMVER